jgi:RNA-directed DNA polymerase
VTLAGDDHRLGDVAQGNSRQRRRITLPRAFENSSRQDRWIFGDRDSGAYLRRFAWTKIVRHRLVMGAASPDNPALDQY